MRKIGIYVMMAALLCSCGKKESDNATEYVRSSSVQEETGTSEKIEESAEKEDSEKRTEAPDYEAQITEEVEKALDSVETLQEKMAKVEKVAKKYEKLLRKEDGSQVELNERAKNVQDVWDASLNHVWKEMRGAIDKKTMAALQKEQEKWVKCKENVAEMAVSEYKEGSIYPMLYSMELADITRNRVYQVMSFYAEEKGDPFEMPERSEFGSYIDNMGTGSIYSSLIIKEGMEKGTMFAAVSVYRTGEAEGTVKEKGKALIFKCSEFGMNGKITYGWNGAVLKVIKAKKKSPFHKGDVFKFPVAF